MDANYVEKRPGPPIGRLYFLDGLRGLGAVMVLLSHLIPGFFMLERITETRPFLRLLCDGSFAVYIFFIISGFALSESLKKYRKIRLGPLLLKRYARLAVPVFCATMLAWMIHRMGWMRNQTQETSPWIQAFYNFNPKFWRAVFDGLAGSILGKGVKYDPVLWSIRPEFASSVCLYIACFGQELVKRLIGAPGIFVLILGASIGLLMGRVHFGFDHGPLYFCFFVGALISRLMRPVASSQVKRCVEVGCLALFGMVVWGCLFKKGGDSSGVKSACLAVLLFISVLGSGVLQRVFGSAAGCFLGYISFPLYLIHLPLLCSVGPYLYKLSKESPLLVSAGPVLVTVGCLIITCFGAALLFALIEEPLLKWVYSKISRWL